MHVSGDDHEERTSNEIFLRTPAVLIYYLYVPLNLKSGSLSFANNNFGRPSKSVLFKASFTESISFATINGTEP